MVKRKKINEARKVTCSRARNKGNDVPFIASDIIASILQRLPARFLYDSCRPVCKTWDDILRVPGFIMSNLLNAESGFYIESLQGCCVKFIRFREWNLEAVLKDDQFPGHLRDSSDGVLLIQGSHDNINLLYVANPIMKQVRKLPDPLTGVRFFCTSSKIAHLADLGVFKVVTPGRQPDKPTEIYVLTVGVDMSWRKLDITAPPDGIRCFFYKKSITVDGVIYWMVSHSTTDRSVIAIDLHDESIHYINVPMQFNGQKWVPEKMGKNLCCMNEVTNGTMNIWLLKDMHRSEWILLGSVNLFKLFRLKDGCRLAPLIYLESQQVLLLNYFGRPTRFGVVAYNLKTGQGKKLMGTDIILLIQRHTFSLIRI